MSGDYLVKQHIHWKVKGRKTGEREEINILKENEKVKKEDWIRRSEYKRKKQAKKTCERKKYKKI